MRHARHLGLCLDASRPNDLSGCIGYGPVRTPPIAVVDYIALIDPWLPWTATMAMAVRLGLSVAAKKRLDQTAIANAQHEMMNMDRARTPGPLSPYLKSIRGAFLATVLISGLFDSVVRAIWTFGIVAALFLVRGVVLPKVDSWQWWSHRISQVPLIVRWFATVVAAFAVTRAILFVPSLSARVNLAPGAFGAEIFCFLLGLIISFALLPQPAKAGAYKLSDTARWGGKLAVLLCVFVLATQPVYAEICLDPFCCFGANSLLAALAIAALVLLLLPFLLDGIVLSELAIALGAGIENAIAAIAESAFAQTVAGRVVMGLLGIEARWQIPRAARDKIPSKWGEGKANNKDVGWRWFDPTNERGRGVRIDKGDPYSDYPSQRVDHVVVRDGPVLGRDGQPVTQGSGSIKHNPWEAHIPLKHWLKWPAWNKAPEKD